MKNISKKIKNSKQLQTIIISSVVVVLLLLVGVFLATENRISIENSLVVAPVSLVTPSTPGILKEVDVTDGQKVSKGDQLAIVGTETLRAYTDGIVVDTNKAIGGTVGQTTPVVKIIRASEMRIDGTIDENKGLDRINVGQPVSFTVDALPGQKFWGYVDEVSPTAKVTQAAFTISSNRPTQQFDIYARFDTSKYPQIKNGMSAKMTVFTNTN